MTVLVPTGGSPLTPSDTLGYLSRLLSKRTKTMDWINHNDADLQAPEPQAGEQARVSGAHEDEGRSQGVEPSSEARSDPSSGHDRSEVTAASPARKERLPRSARIRHSTEIRALLERGKRKRTTNVDVFFTPSPASHSRLGQQPVGQVVSHPGLGPGEEGRQRHKDPQQDQ